MTDRQRWLFILVAIVIAAFAVGLLAGSAEAATGEQIADNIEAIVRGIVGSVWVAIVVVVVVMLLPGRKFIELAVFLAFATVVGGIIAFPGEFAGTVRDIWRTVMEG